MKPTKQWLEEVAKEYEAKNWFALARLLDVTRSSISQQVNGLHSISVTTALKVADLLGVHPLAVISSSAYEASKSDEHKDLWKRVHEAYAGLKADSRCSIYKPPPGWNEP